MRNMRELSGWAAGLALTIALGLTACGGSTGADGSAEAAPASAAAELVSSDADLSAQSRLALGILDLESTAQAVDETQAGTMLPLWQALQALSDSETAAPAELDALVGQIQRTLTAEQIAAINGMDLSVASLEELMASGDFSFGRAGAAGEAGGFASGSPTGDFAGGPPTGDFAGGGGPGGAGGGPGGAIPGGGFAGGELTEDQLATREAAMGDIDPTAMQSRMLAGMVVRLLQEKTGQAPVGPGLGGPAFEQLTSALADATGLTVEELQTQMQAGQSAADIITATGGDVATVREQLIEALSDQSTDESFDPAQLVDRLLGLEPQP